MLVEGAEHSREALELDSDGQPTLELSQHVRGFAGVKRAAADEQNMVGGHVPILCAHNRALNDGQQVPLDTLRTGISPCTAFHRVT